MPKKELGQHWLKDKIILENIVNEADICSGDTILEIGPGLGTLTSVLLRNAKNVIAVEYDDELAQKLPSQFPGKNLKVINQDILNFDLTTLPKGYKVVANVPYYITSKIIEKLMTSTNKPKLAVLLVQKEVAERIGAKPGNLSVLGIASQVYATVRLGIKVDKKYFTPPPKVDSEVVILNTLTKPLVSDEKSFFRVVKAGFSAKRKKLRSSISAGLNISTAYTEELLNSASINPNLRAQDINIEQWIALSEIVAENKI